MSSPYIVCLVPTRGDRPKMLKRCLEMMSLQTVLPREVILVNDPPIDPSVKDITWRYRRGVERAIERHPEVELILFIEDDDWYSKTYVEVFYKAWESAGKPEIFGLGETFYYNVGTRRYFHQIHEDRASAFCTGVTKSISNIKWPEDSHSFIDLEMWKQLKGKTFKVSPLIALGIKGYNEGQLFGGIGHNNNWNGYKNEDPNLNWIKSVIGDSSISFYFEEVERPIGTFDKMGPIM